MFCYIWKPHKDIFGKNSESFRYILKNFIDGLKMFQKKFFYILEKIQKTFGINYMENSRNFQKLLRKVLRF